MANMIARLGVLLGLDTAQFNQGLAQSESKIDQFTTKAKTRLAALVAGFAAMTTKAVMFADEVADIAQANDVAIDSVIKLQNALAGAGGKADDAGKIFSSFTAYVDKAADGSLEAHKNFTKIGVTFRDLESLSTQQLFFKAIQGLADIEDPLTRSAKAMEILGKAAKGVDLQGMNDLLREQTGATDSQAKSIKILADFYDKVTQAGRDFTLVFADFVSPAIEQLNRGLDNLKKFTDSAGGIIQFINNLKNSIVEYRRANLEEEVAGFERYLARTKEGTSINDWLKRQIADRKKTLAELTAPLPSGGVNVGGGRSAGPGGVLVQPQTDLPKIRDIKKPVDPEEERRRREAEAAQQKKMQAWANSMRRYEAEQEALDQQELAYARIVGSLVDYDNAQKRLMDTEEGLFVLESQRKQMKEYDYEFARSRIQLLAEQEQAQQRLNEAELLPADREAAQQRLNEIYQRRLDLLKQIRDVAAAADADVGAWQGFKDAASDFFKNLPKDMETGAMMFQSVMGNMNQALDNFVRTGKLNFKDFARSIILDLIAIQLKASAMKLLSTLFGFNIPGKAAGGTVSGGSAYVVGERGPELFVPRMSGTIIPNHALSNVGGGTTVTNNYINAIDVKSFEQRLMGSNKAIWAATQYAQKGLAVTPGRG